MQKKKYGISSNPMRDMCVNSAKIAAQTAHYRYAIGEQDEVIKLHVVKEVLEEFQSKAEHDENSFVCIKNPSSENPEVIKASIPITKNPDGTINCLNIANMDTDCVYKDLINFSLNSDNKIVSSALSGLGIKDCIKCLEGAVSNWKASCPYLGLKEDKNFDKKNYEIPIISWEAQIKTYLGYNNKNQRSNKKLYGITQRQNLYAQAQQKYQNDLNYTKQRLNKALKSANNSAQYGNVQKIQPKIEQSLKEATTTAQKLSQQIKRISNQNTDYEITQTSELENSLGFLIPQNYEVFMTSVNFSTIIINPLYFKNIDNNQDCPQEYQIPDPTSTDGKKICSITPLTAMANINAEYDNIKSEYLKHYYSLTSAGLASLQKKGLNSIISTLQIGISSSKIKHKNSRVQQAALFWPDWYPLLSPHSILGIKKFLLRIFN